MTRLFINISRLDTIERVLNHLLFQGAMDEDKKKLVLGVIMVFFMVSSVFGVLFFGFHDNTGGGINAQQYNGLKFTTYQNQWKVEIDGEDKLFYYYPQDIDYIDVDDSVVGTFQNAKMVYFTSDAESALKGPIAQSIFYFADDLGGENVHVVTAFTDENEFSLPVITCADATETVPVVMYTTGNKTGVSSIGSCIVLEGDSDVSFGRLTERILYGYYGVIV